MESANSVQVSIIVTCGSSFIAAASALLISLILSAGRFFVAELGITSHSTIGILRIVRLELVNNQLHVAGDRLRVGLLVEIVRPHQHHDARRIERDHIIVQPHEHPARRIAADAAIGHFHALKHPLHVVAPTFGDRIAEEHKRPVLLIGLARRSASADRATSA